MDATIDQYFTSPPEGWPGWMDRHIRDDDFVVMVCTETYYRRVVRKEAPGIGLGVRWEGSLIYNHLYKSDLSRFVPVLLNGGKPDYIPEPVAGATHYPIDMPGGYEGLLRRLFNRPTAEMLPIGERPELPPLPAQWTESPLAELHNVPELPPHFLPRPDAFEGLKSKLLGPAGSAVAVTGVAPRIGVQGMGGIGKSVLTAAVVRDDEVRSAFPAGIFWISLGQTPDVLTRQADLYWLLTREKGGFADAQQGRIALQEALRGRGCLVILDDVWRLADRGV